MSAETKAALDAAVAAHFADERDNGALLTGYVLKVCGVNPASDDGQNDMMFAILDSQSPFLSIGLARALVEDMETSYRGWLTRDR